MVVVVVVVSIAFVMHLASLPTLKALLFSCHIRAASLAFSLLSKAFLHVCSRRFCLNVPSLRSKRGAISSLIFRHFLGVMRNRLWHYFIIILVGAAVVIPSVKENEDVAPLRLQGQMQRIRNVVGGKEVQTGNFTTHIFKKKVNFFTIFVLIYFNI